MSHNIYIYMNDRVTDDDNIDTTHSGNVNNTAGSPHTNTGDSALHGDNSRRRGRGRPPSVNAELFVARHRQRSNEYYKRTAKTLPKFQCEFISPRTGARCVRMTNVRLANDGVTALKCYCAKHKYRDLIDCKKAAIEIMTDLD